MYKDLNGCRACGYGTSGAQGIKSAPADKLVPVFDLGVQPLANDFVAAGGEHKGFAPLKVLFCPRCSLAQLSVVVDPAVLYKDYPYVTSNSETMHVHFAKLLSTIREEQSVLKVLEIGSNDGALLKYLRQEGATSLFGVDPAANLASRAEKDHIPTVASVWDRQCAQDLSAYFKDGVDIILARHVFCHVDDWKTFIHNCAVPSKKDTLLCIEVPYVKDLLEKGEFDTIYHEHTSYLSIRAMRAVLAGSPFRLHRIQKFSVHGGAILLMLRRTDYEGPPHGSCQGFLDAEDITEATWKEFAFGADKKIAELGAFVRNARTNGKRVVGYGASAKSTVWVNACGFTRREIEFITDNTPAKVWKYSPGSDIPITDEGALTRELPDYAVCFAWNYFEEIYEKEKLFREKGGKWIVPHPSIKIV